MKHMIDREAFTNIQETRSALERLQQQIAEFLTPPMKDLSTLHEVSEFLDTAITTNNRFTRSKIKVIVLLFLYAPAYIIHKGYKRERKNIASAIAEELGMSKALFSHQRSKVIQRYKCYGKFASLVDEAYEKVAEHYHL